MPLALKLVGAGLFVALLTSQHSLLLLCSLILFTVGAAKLWSHASLAQLRSALRVDKLRLFPGETLALAVTVENTRFLPVWLRVSLPLAAALPKGRVPAPKDTGLLAYQRASFEWQVTARRRGVHRIGPVQLEAADPLGFFPRSRAASECEVLVYPLLVALAPTALPRRDFLGRRSPKSPVDDPTNIQGLRDYQPSRPARFIHWKASARTQRIVEKTFQATEHEKVLLLLRADAFTDAAHSGALERCLEVIASIAAGLDRERHAFGFASNGKLVGGAAPVLQVARSAGQLSALLELLARWHPAADSSLLDVVQSAHTLPRTLTVVYFDYALDEVSQATHAFFQHHKLALTTVICGPSKSDAIPGVVRLRELYVDA
jgi:uncharacterized protein (DUF58 family)